MTPEAAATRAILLATTHLVDWGRNNGGVYNRNPMCPRCGLRPYPNAGDHWIRYGVGGPGGSDQLGIVRGTGQAIVCEIKSAIGRPTKEQLQFIARVQRDGGLGLVARRPEDVLRLLGVTA